MSRFTPIAVFCWLLFVPHLPAQGLYDLDHITKIELTFAEADWEYPLHYYRSLGKGERHLGRATVNGVRFDSVGVRFKGFSSYRRSYRKNPMNIKLDYVHKKADYQGFESLKLSNGNLDPSWLREVLGYQIARKYMVAPQSNYAQVFANGKYYGLFGNTENVDGKFAHRHFHSGKNGVIIKGNSPLGPFAGKRSSLEYLGPDSMAYAATYELENDHGWGELMQLTKVLKFDPKNIETVLDMDGAIWMLAFNNVLVNLDSYSDFQQNYYLVQDRNGRFHFVIWDVNLAFDGLGKPQGVTMQADYDPLAKKDDPRFPLINLVLNDPTYRKTYFAHCRTILEENFANGWYRQEAERLRAIIDQAVQQDNNWVFDHAAFEKNFTETYLWEDNGSFPYPGITAFVEARVAFLQNHPEYKKLPPEIWEAMADSNHTNGREVAVTAGISNATSVQVGYRYGNDEIFQKKPMFDDGRHGDEQANDGIYGAFLPLGEQPLQYYVFAENREAACFSPSGAEHAFFTFQPEQQ